MPYHLLKTNFLSKQKTVVRDVEIAWYNPLPLAGELGVDFKH